MARSSTSMRQPRRLPGERLSQLSQLHREVRTLSQHLHSQALDLCRVDKTDYLARVSSLIDELIDRGDAREKVKCLASATELGLSPRHQDEHCREAAVRSGCEALLALYWTTNRRMNRNPAGNSWLPRSDIVTTPKSQTTPVAQYRSSVMAESDGQLARSPAKACCKWCEELHADPRRATGHNALRPTSPPTFCDREGFNLTLMQRHRCRICDTVWAQHSNRSEPFMSWAIVGRFTFS